MDNHFHLLVRENLTQGISRYMHRIGTSMSKCFNEKYNEQGTLFEGPYQVRVVETDRQLQYLQAYIHVKNPLELYPGGTERALGSFAEALEWIRGYPYAGFSTEGDRSALVDARACREVLLEGDSFRRYALDVLAGRNLPNDWDRVSIDA